MGIEIKAVGGYYEVGKNMTAVRVDDEVIIFDMGLHLPHYIKLTEMEGEDMEKISTLQLKIAKAIPNDGIIKEWKHLVKAIIPTHAHLDHVGAIPYLAPKYHNVPIIGTPFTLAVIRGILRDEKIKIPNPLKVLNPNSSCKISDKLTLEFINMTHSTPQTVMAALHTPYGIILYANDFKLDNRPVIGKKPNYELLERARESGVHTAIIDCLYADKNIKTPSESVAREMLKDVLLNVDSRGKKILVTTFSSHIARLESIVEFSQKLGRRVVFLGRSMAKYVAAAEEAGVAYFSKDVEIVKYGSKIRRKLGELEKKGFDKYLLVVTGHQGEPKSTLSRMVNKEIPFHFDHEDHVIFACQIIPTKINREMREELEKKLKSYGVRIFRDIHVSGHASREDLRDLIHLLNPRHIIPAHGEKDKVDAFKTLCEELGYKHDKTFHALKNGTSFTA